MKIAEELFCILVLYFKMHSQQKSVEDHQIASVELQSNIGLQVLLAWCICHNLRFVRNCITTTCGSQKLHCNKLRQSEITL